MTRLQRARIGMGMSIPQLADYLQIDEIEVEAMLSGKTSLTREAEAFIHDAIDDGLSAYNFDIEGEK